jgi:membrane fusion protein, hemolysin D
MPATLRSIQALVEFESPTAAVIARPIPRGARMTTWVVAGAILSSITVMGLYPVDKVVAVPGKVVATSPNIVVQPLDTSIVRQISVHEGQIVHAGDRLAMLDPTFAAADAAATDAQVVSLRAEVGRLEAESEGNPYTADGSQPGQLQAVIYTQRHAEMQAKLENYAQRIESLRAKVQQTSSDINSYAEQYKVAQTKENMRRELERLQVGSKLSTLDADAQRSEVNRALQAAFAAHKSAHAELDGLMAERDGYIQRFRTETAQQLAEEGRKLADAQEQATKAALRRRLVDLRADRDAIVLNVAKVSVGSVVQSGDELITMVPADTLLQVEASIPAREAGFVHSGNHAVIKFETLPYTTYGYATGTLQTVSADSFASPRTRRERPARPTLSQPDPEGGAAFYRGTLSVDEMKLHNLPEGFHMSPGMPVTTDIKVGKRTVLAYLVSRIVPALTEGMREP